MDFQEGGGGRGENAAERRKLAQNFVSHLEILVVLLKDVDKIKLSEVVYFSIIVRRRT